MGLVWLLAFPLSALAVSRSQHVRLWIATGRIRRPTWRRALAVGAIWGALQGSIVLYFDRSLLRAAIVAMIWVSFFIVFPPVLWGLFHKEIGSPRPR
jgi:hypothetical protein